MYFALRLISASAILGLFLSRSLSEKKLSISLPLILALAAGSLVYEQSLLTADLLNKQFLLNLTFGLFLGSLLSIPIFALDLVSQSIAANFKNFSTSSLKLLIVLGLLIQLFNLDYLPYFFSILIKTRNFEPSLFSDPTLLINVGSTAFLSTMQFLLPGFAIFTSTFLFFCILSIFSPSILNLGTKVIMKIIITISLMLFYFTYSSSFLHDLMTKITAELLK